MFGCIGHVHIPEAKHTKLDNKSCKCVFIGVSEESKAYKMYNPILRKVMVRRDVVFEEEENWDWGKKNEGEVSEILTWENDGENTLGEKEYLQRENHDNQNAEAEETIDDAEEIITTESITNTSEPSAQASSSNAPVSIQNKPVHHRVPLDIYVTMCAIKRRS